MTRREQARGRAVRLRRTVLDLARQDRFAEGAQLPTERALAARFELSRNTVRKVLKALEAEGLIERGVGRGTFARRRRPLDPAETDAGSQARGDSPEAKPAPRSEKSVNPEEVMEARLLIEPMLARLVVTRASEEELEELERLVGLGGAAASMAEFEHWDNLLHATIARISKNKYLTEIVEGIHSARRSPGWSALRRRGLTDERRALYQADHEQIVAALRQRDGDAAQSAILAHLQNVRRNLFLI
jgi:DNA-binding FadR family transcriptional regulator